MADTESLPQMMTVAQLAEALQVSTTTIYRWVEDGTVPAYRFGRGRGSSIRFRHDEIMRLFEVAP